jgi:hypothetical protein
MYAPLDQSFANNLKSWSTFNFLRAEHWVVGRSVTFNLKFSVCYGFACVLKMSDTNLTFNEQLIEEVKKYPFLFNKKERHYKSTVKKSRAWEEIGRKLYVTGNKG